MKIKSRGLSENEDRRMEDELTGLLEWPARKLLEKRAPADYATPAGSRHPIDYGAEGGPTVSVRVQEKFGLTRHPSVGEPAKTLILAPTSPQHRPTQTRRDIAVSLVGS